MTHKCVYMEGVCMKHMTFRVVVSALWHTPAEWPCPRCHPNSEPVALRMLGTGYTVRELPFVESIDHGRLHCTNQEQLFV